MIAHERMDTCANVLPSNVYVVCFARSSSPFTAKLVEVAIATSKCACNRVALTSHVIWLSPTRKKWMVMQNTTT